MTEEEMQRKMEFIIEQQAQFAVNMDLLGDRVDQLAEAQQRTEKTLEQTVRVQNHLIQVVSTLVEAQERTETKMAQLAETQVHTDERLNSLINVVERFISEGRNGTSQS